MADSLLKLYLGGDALTTKDDVQKADSKSLMDQYFSDTQDKLEAKPEQNKEFWQGLNEADGFTGFAKRLGVGALRGVKNVIDTGAHGLQNATTFVADKVLPESLAAPIRQNVEQSQSEDKAASAKFNTEYPPSQSIIPSATGAGKFAGEVAATMPLMPAKAFQAIRGVAGALPTVLSTGEKVAAPLVNRLGSAVVEGDLGGAIYGGATSSTNDKSLAQNVGEGMLGGAIGGPAVVGTASLAKELGGKIIGEVSPRVAELAKLAKDKYGIDLRANQVTNSSFIKKYDQMSGMLPFSGKQNSDLVPNFTKAVSKTFGEDTAEITPTVIRSAKKRLGKDYETVAANTTIQADQNLVQSLHKTYQDATAVLNPDHLKIFEKQLEHIFDKFNNGQMSGEAWQAMRKTTEPMTRLVNSRNNVELGQSVKAVRDAMDGAFNRSAPDDMKQLLKTANSQYKSMKTVEKLVEADANGHVSPLRLMQKVSTSPGGKEYSGDLGELADIGKAFFRQPNDSGTPLGTKILDTVAPFLHSPVAAGSAAAGALAKGATYLDLGAGASTLVANRLIRSAVNSNAVKNAIIRSGTGETYGSTNKLGEAVLPYSAALAKPRNPLRITVYKDEDTSNKTDSK